ncbi:MAG: MFS transporter, partial [Dehalococcoidia bacterium]
HTDVKRAERSLRFSTREGMSYGAVQGFGEHFTSPYAIALGATNTQLGLLTSLPSFLGALAQLSSARFVKLLGNRKRTVLLFAALSGFMWIPILSVGYLFESHRSDWLIGFLTLYVLFGLMVVPPWGSIMAEVVPHQLRGRYFGLRSRWSTLANLVTFIIAGGLLYLFRDRGLTGFVLVFGVAFGFRMISVALLTTLFELPHSPKEEESLSPRDFLRQLPRSNLGRTMLFIFSMNFAVNLAGPFFAPYMLRELKMDYVTFTILEAVSIVATFWAVSHWGAAADRVGNRKMLTFASFLIAVVPLMWMVSADTAYLGFAEAYTGLVWAGFNLVSVNFIYDATTAHNRTAYLAYFATGAGIATSLGALAGGFLIPHMPMLKGSTILSIFLLSGILRLLVAAVFLPRIQEVRRVREIPAAELFHIMMGGRSVHRPAHRGRMQINFHGHRNVVPKEPG